MPEQPGRPSPSRVTWIAPAVVLGLVAAVGLAVGLSASGRSSTATTSPVITAPTSPVPTSLQPDVPLAPRLRPVARLGRCARGGRVLRVLQFNIRYGISRKGGLGLSALGEEIEAVRPDVVSLNEVDSGTFRSRRIDEAAYLAQATGLHAVYGPNLPWEGGLFGNAILTRYPVLATSNVHLPRATGLEQRGLLTATLRVGGRRVSFSSMHLSDGPDGRSSRVLEARAVASVLRDATYPTILAGDLNSSPGSLPVRTLRPYLLDAQEQGGIGTGDTIPEQAPQRRIDYVLYDDHFAVVPGSTRVLPSSSSDHRSVFTELTLLPRPCAG